MPDEPWSSMAAALDRAADRGTPIQVWLRDDDAVAPTPALDRLVRLCETHGMPVLLAVIPAQATPALAEAIHAHPSIAPTQHGFDHTNHAAAGERARELGGLRPIAAIVDDLARGRARLTALFAARAASILVPPWNRIDDAVLPALPGLGFEALSTFGPATTVVPGLAILNTDVDIIDWRNGRACRPHSKLADKIAGLVAQATVEPRPIGLLTHHLAHDAAAWAFLDACLSRLAAHPAVRFSAAQDLLSAGSVSA